MKWSTDPIERRVSVKKVANPPLINFSKWSNDPANWVNTHPLQWPFIERLLSQGNAIMGNDHQWSLHSSILRQLHNQTLKWGRRGKKFADFTINSSQQNKRVIFDDLLAELIFYCNEFIVRQFVIYLLYKRYIYAQLANKS